MPSSRLILVGLSSRCSCAAATIRRKPKRCAYEESENWARRSDGRGTGAGQKPDSSGHYRELRTIAGKANLIGSTEVSRGSWQKLAETEKLIRAVSADDVKRVAAQYLTSKNRTVGTLIPETAKSEVKQ